MSHCQAQRNVRSPTRQTTAKSGAPTPQSPPTPGLSRSTVAPRQRGPSFPLRPPRPPVRNRLCWSRRRPPSPRAPAPCRRENSDTALSGRTERPSWPRSRKRRANPPMSPWSRWVSGQHSSSWHMRHFNGSLYIIQLLWFFSFFFTPPLSPPKDNQRLHKANETLRRKLKEAEREVERLKTMLKRHALHPVEEDSSS